jgi:predicted lysophospholipase L1 biosynthesis ABC-type transport system permease subunit
MFFVPLAQRVNYNSEYRMMIEQLSHVIQGIMLVTDAPQGKLEPLLRKTLAEADPNLTITSVRTMRQQIDLSLDRERAVAALAQLFGVVTLVLAAIGVYGVTAYMVAQLRNEIGIRMALGADPARVIQFVLRQSFQRVAIGIVVGLPLAVSAARLMAAQLYRRCGSGILSRLRWPLSRWLPVRCSPHSSRRPVRPRSRRCAPCARSK